MRPLTNRRTFLTLSIGGSPLVVLGLLWTLDGLGVRTDDHAVQTYVAVLVAVIALFVLVLGKILRRTATEIVVAGAVSAGTTVLSMALLVMWALGRADLN